MIRDPGPNQAEQGRAMNMSESPGDLTRLGHGDAACYDTQMSVDEGEGH